MRRSNEQRSVSVRAWLVATVLVGGGVFALFHFADPRRLGGRWPLGISRVEVDAYAGLSALPFVAEDSVRIAVVYLSATAKSGRCWPEDRGRGWDTRWMETTGFGDSVEVRPLRSEADGLVVRLRGAADLRGQRSFTLRKLTDALLRARLVQLMAVELDVLSPELSLVRVISCGRDLGIHVKEEVVDAHFLRRHGAGDAVVVDVLFDPRAAHALAPLVKEDSLANAQLNALWRGQQEAKEALDVDAWARWSLLRSLAVPHDPWSGEHPMAYGLAELKLWPVWRAPRTTAANPMSTLREGPIGTMVHTEAYVTAFRKAQDRLQARRGELRDRMLGVAAVWVPKIHADDADHLHMARSAALIDELLAALQDRAQVTRTRLPLEPTPGHALLAGISAPSSLAPAAAPGTDALARLKRMTRLIAQGDSVVFPRGKYRIDGELRFPQGHRVIMLPGARIELGPDAQLQVRGELDVRGTKLNPVFIRSAAKGVQHKGIDVVGGAGDKAVVSGLQMSGGRKDGAMLRLQGLASVLVTGCVLEGASGGAALHVLGGEVEVRGGLVQGAVLQLTQAKTVMKDVVVRGAGRGRGPGGVLVEGGRARIEGGAVMGLEGAGIRGTNAAQVLLLNTLVEGCATGLQVRDGATFHADDVRFRRNDLVMSVSSAGAMRGAAKVVLYRNSFQDNARDREVDGGSSVTDGGVLSDVVRSGERFTP
jgi:hypothetical protein